MTPDTETAQVLADQERALRLSHNEDWLWAKGQLLSLLEVFTDVTTLPDNVTATALQQEIKQRKKVVGIFKAWLELVEGTGTQASFNKPDEQAQSFVHYEE